MPEISVIMSVSQEKPSYLKEALESILRQTYTNFEFLIVDDGAPKEIAEILEHYAALDTRILILKNTINKGLTKSLNIAIQQAQGNYIARMDSDDVSLPQRLEKQLLYIQEKKIDLLGTGCLLINAEGTQVQDQPGKNPHLQKQSLLKGNFFIHSSLFGTKAVFCELYNEAFLRAQDYEFLLRVLAKGYALENMQESLIAYRLHDTSVTAKKAKAQEWYGIRARFRAIFRYGYSVWGVFYLIRSFLILLLPYKLKRHLVMKK